MTKFPSTLFLFGSIVILISISFIILYEIPTTSDNLIEKQYDEFELLFINHYLFKDKEGIPETISYFVSGADESDPPILYGSGSFKSNYDSYTFTYRMTGNFLGYFGIDGYDDNCLPRPSMQYWECSNYKPLIDD